MYPFLFETGDEADDFFKISWSDIHSTGSDHGSGLGVYGIRTQEGHFVVNGVGTIWRDGRDHDLAQCSVTCASLHMCI